MSIVEKIAAELKLDIGYVSSVVERSSYYYKNYTIPKKQGGVRRVSQPSPELKTLQYWVVKNILKEIPVSQIAYAYKQGDSIKRHAQAHHKSKFILHADICNFFPSIHPDQLRVVLRKHQGIFEKLNLDIEDAVDEIIKICFKKDQLCIGAVSSPIISNIIMFDFDNVLLERCMANGYTCSRYADDIYISSKKYMSEDIISFLELKLKDNGFLINRSKTKFYSSKYRRRVTGLILTDTQQVTIGSERRNNIKKMIYDKLVHGKGNPEQILGYLSFLKDIEPITYNNIIIKYSQYCSGDIITELSK